MITRIGKIKRVVSYMGVTRFVVVDQDNNMFEGLCNIQLNGYPKDNVYFAFKKGVWVYQGTIERKQYPASLYN